MKNNLCIYIKQNGSKQKENLIKIENPANIYISI